MSMYVRDLSEFALIDRLVAALPDGARGLNTVDGQQDDCAYWWRPVGKSVVTTDALIEDVHFRLDWTDWRSLGHKMLAVNLSDLASMGCAPEVAVVALALTGNELVEDLEELYRGAGALAEAYGVAIVGGDIVRTSGPIMLSVTAIGEQINNEPVLLRSAAKIGDVVLVSGTLGASAAGMQLLQKSESGAATAELLIGAHLRPLPRISLGRELVQAGVRCCMDISDGLGGDLPRILNASQVGAEIDLDAIPVLPAVRALFPESWLQLALHGGEDYELLCTAPPEIVDYLIARADGVGATLTPIGKITDREGIGFRQGGAASSVRFSRGWDHFALSQE